MPKQRKLSAKDFELVTPTDDRAPDEPASAGTQVDEAQGLEERRREGSDRGRRPGQHRGLRASGSTPTRSARTTLERAGLTGQLDSLLASKMPGYETVQGLPLQRPAASIRRQMELQPLRKGSQVIAGTVLGRIGKTDRARAARPLRDPPGRPRGAEDRPEADPRRLEAARGDRDLPRRRQEPVRGEQRDASQVLLMSKAQLIERVLADPSLEIYACGREDIHTGQIDRRVLAMLEYLVARGLRPHDHLAQVRPLGPHHLRQRLRALHRQRRRHRPDQRHPGDRPPGPGLDHRGAGQGPAAAAGDDEAAPDHLADGLLRRRQHLRDGRPRRPRPRRLPAGRRAGLRQRSPSSSRRC